MLFISQTIQRREQQATTLTAVGFNPFRRQDKTTVDVIIVAVFLVIIVLVVLWAILGG